MCVCVCVMSVCISERREQEQTHTQTTHTHTHAHTHLLVGQRQVVLLDPDRLAAVVHDAKGGFLLWSVSHSRDFEGVCLRVGVKAKQERPEHEEHHGGVQLHGGEQFMIVAEVLE
jgi:hypothetical protein